MLCFQNLDSPTLMEFFFPYTSTHHCLQIGQYGTGLGTLVSNFGDPSKLHFHNLIGGPYVGF